MIKQRDKKTGAISFIPTAEDLEKNRLNIRLVEMERKIKYLENLIIDIKKEDIVDEPKVESVESTTKTKRKNKTKSIVGDINND